MYFQISGCNQRQGESGNNDHKIQQSNTLLQIIPDTSITNYYKDISLKREDGRFLKYYCEGEHLFIEYGNNDFKKVLQDTFPCSMPYVGIPMLWADNKDRILLSFGCGSPCWGVFELPLKQKDTVTQFMYHYDYDERSNILIHLSYYEPKDKYVLLARNLSTKASEVIEIEDCGSAFIGSCIDSINLIENQLFVQLKTMKEIETGSDQEGIKTIIRKIKI